MCFPKAIVEVKVAKKRNSEPEMVLKVSASENQSDFKYFEVNLLP